MQVDWDDLFTVMNCALDGEPAPDTGPGGPDLDMFLELFNKLVDKRVRAKLELTMGRFGFYDTHDTPTLKYDGETIY
ncbi:hypothetical protein FDI24_gp051 [Acidovorax phage ACP17]|uniref:Uncharacterized protein n=1 Tax=Acidovorax phage ACP17 TaxID=2010329 RepID=A0A223AIY3_9CAUD|nr:hypothetical protein FDI24_gp051 [Acidovorax phage ACP17]ASS33919.1 hypothetical protein [Acidovorax phage ACP17]